MLDLVLNHEVTLELIQEYINATFKQEAVEKQLCKRTATPLTFEQVVEMEIATHDTNKRQKQDEKET